MVRILLVVCASFVLAVPALAADLFRSPQFGVQVTPNITYGTGAVQNGASTANLTLDLYQPTPVATPLPAQSPAIVLVHGGGFIGGDKADMAPLAQEYASLGYVVMSINYRMYGDLPPSSSPGPADNFTPPPAGYDTFPNLILGDNAINAAVQDAEKAIDWIRATRPPTTSPPTGSASAVRRPEESRPNWLATTIRPRTLHPPSCSTSWAACTAPRE